MPNSIQEAMKGINTSAIQEAMKGMNTLAIQEAMKGMNTLAIQEAIKELNTTSLVYYGSASLTASSNLRANAYVTTIQADPIEISTIFEHIRDVDDSFSFHQIFANIPPWLQFFIMYLIMQAILPITYSIIANLATPYVESLIKSSEKPNRELIKDIASISIDNLDLGKHRFVTVANLHLRKKASTKSRILDNLQLGKILTVISKNRNWLEVTYRHSDGKVMKGWVFSRYTEKFKK